MQCNIIYYIYLRAGWLLFSSSSKTTELLKKFFLLIQEMSGALATKIHNKQSGI